MITHNQDIELTNLNRHCAVCGEKLTIIIYPNKNYKGGHYFGKVKLGKTKKAEYWECISVITVKRRPLNHRITSSL